MSNSPAYLDGWRAHKAGHDSDNPYDEGLQSYSFGQWQSGWCDRFSAVKHGRSLETDNEE